MSHTYTSNRIHCIFSTKERRKLITAPLQDRLWAFMGGIARQNGFQTLAVGGIEDHAHLLILLPGTLPLSKAMQLIKGGSSKWIHETFPEHSEFAWQEGYAGFSVSVSQSGQTIAYINNQVEHHRKRSFEEEYLNFLQKHGIEYDSRYVFG